MYYFSGFNLEEEGVKLFHNNKLNDGMGLWKKEQKYQQYQSLECLR